MPQLFANNATSTLNGGIVAASTLITLQTGDGAKFPSLSGGDWFNVTLYQRINGVEVNHEICKVTDRVSDTLTVQRAAEAIAGAQIARDFNDGDPIELRLTAAMDTNKMTLAQLHAAILSF